MQQHKIVAMKTPEFRIQLLTAEGPLECQVPESVIAKTHWNVLLEGDAWKMSAESRDRLIQIPDIYSPNVIDFCLRYLANATVAQTETDFLIQNSPGILHCLASWCVEPQEADPIILSLKKELQQMTPQDAYASLLAFQDVHTMKHKVADLFFSIPMFWEYANDQEAANGPDALPESWVHTLHLRKAETSWDFSKFTNLETLVGVHPNMHTAFTASQSTLKNVDLTECDLSGVRVPESLLGVTSLKLSEATNIPTELISIALDAQIPSIDLSRCYLAGITVPDSLKGVESLFLYRAKNIPPALISRALEAQIPSIDLSLCDLSGITVPNYLEGVKSLDLSLATNIPPALISRIQRDNPNALHI